MFLKIKISDRTEFIKNKNFFVGRTDDLFINIKEIFKICSRLIEFYSINVFEYKNRF